MTDAIEAGARADLLPCPFCGEKRIFFNAPDPSINFKGSINCPACLASMPREVNDDQELIDCWNGRAAIASGALVPARAIRQLDLAPASVGSHSNRGDRAKKKRKLTMINKAIKTGAEALDKLRSKRSIFGYPSTKIAKRIIQAAIDSGELTPTCGEYVVGWRDISTAPMGEPIDILCQDHENQYRFCDAMILNSEPYAFMLDDGSQPFRPHENGMWPTHWMPTPVMPPLHVVPGTNDGK